MARAGQLDRRQRQLIFWLVIVLAGFAIWGITRPSPIPRVLPAEPRVPASATAVAAPQVAKPSDAWVAKFSSLRDEAIDDIGWVAGNSKGHSEWPSVEPYVGEDGTYYNFFVRLKAPGEDDDAQAFGNVRRYDDAVNKGSAAPHDTDESYDRTKRVLQIADQLGAMMKTLKTS